MLPQEIVDFSAGFGDGVSSVLSFGLYNTTDFRNDFGIDGGVNECSATYEYSKYVGYAWGAGTIWAGGLSGGSNSVFWSGFNQGAKNATTKFGTTIDKTLIGKGLNAFGNYTPDWLLRLASATFAMNAKGSVKAVIHNSGSIWTKIEQPILKWRGIPIQIVR